MEDLRELIGHRPVILPGAVVIIMDEKGHILLQQRRQKEKLWGLPGGIMELGESLEETAEREVFEETNLTVHSLQLLGVFSGRDYFVTAPNGDEFYVVTAAYFTTKYRGELNMDPAESTDLAFINPETLPECMVGSHRRIIGQFLASQRTL